MSQRRTSDSASGDRGSRRPFTRMGGARRATAALVAAVGLLVAFQWIGVPALRARLDNPGTANESVAAKPERHAVRPAARERRSDAGATVALTRGPKAKAHTKTATRPRRRAQPASGGGGSVGPIAAPPGTTPPAAPGPGPPTAVRDSTPKQNPLPLPPPPPVALPVPAVPKPPTLPVQVPTVPSVPTPTVPKLP